MYKTEIIIDKNMPINSENSLDDKFKPESTWKVEEENKINKTGELNDGILKIVTNNSIRSGYGGSTEIPVLMYVKAKYVKNLQKTEWNSIF